VLLHHLGHLCFSADGELLHRLANLQNIEVICPSFTITHLRYTTLAIHLNKFIIISWIYGD